ncbi:MAG: DUF2846 domain-containing protein [Prevotellaceae bacterium]|nr:DUF2846 domain-containing protein [Prevotellaceae bacterium]
MKTLDLRKSAIKCAVIGFVMVFAASVLLTGCGSASSTTASELQPPEYQADETCALFHIYRPNSIAGMAIGYDLYFDNEFVYRVTNKSKITIRVASEGIHTLWAETESKTELPIDVKFGNEYYIKCGVGMGVLVGRPKLELVYNDIGWNEYSKIKTK